MADEAHALRRKRPERSPVLWMSIAMVGCWIGACALSLVISFNWIA